MPFFQRRSKEAEHMASQDVTVDYAGRLAFIGRRVDDERCRSVTILEVSNNFIVRATGIKDGTPNLMEVVAEDFAQGRTPSRSPKSTSYAAILGAIGKHLDRKVAADVAILETPSAYHIVGWERGHAAGQLAYVAFESTLDRHRLQRMIAEGD